MNNLTIFRRNHEYTLDLIEKSSADPMDIVTIKQRCKTSLPGILFFPAVVLTKISVDLFLVWYDTEAKETERFSSVYIPDFTGGNIFNFYLLVDIVNIPSIDKQSALKIFTLVLNRLQLLAKEKEYQHILPPFLPPNMVIPRVSDDFLGFTATQPYTAIDIRLNTSFNYPHSNN